MDWYKKKAIAYLLREIPAVSISPIMSIPSENTDFSSSDLHFTAISEYTHRSNYKKFQRMKLLHPGNRFFLWKDNEIKIFLLREFPDLYSPNILDEMPGIIMSDLFRVAITAKYSGTYFDLKSGFIKELDLLCDKPTFILEDNQLRVDGCLHKVIANWFISGGKSKLLFELHSYLLKCYFTNRRSDFESFAAYVKATTGPHSITNFLLRDDNLDRYLLINSDGGNSKLFYACKNSWVREVLHGHYSTQN